MGFELTTPQHLVCESNKAIGEICNAHSKFYEYFSNLCQTREGVAQVVIYSGH